MDRFLKIIFVFLIIFLVSCKTQKQPGYYNQTEGNQQEKEKPRSVSPDIIKKEKVNEFAERKSKLLCEMKQLTRELNNTNNEDSKAQVYEEIKKLMNQTAEIDKEIESVFQDQQSRDEIDFMAQQLATDC